MGKQLENEPEKFRRQYKVHKIYRVGGKNQGGSGFPKQQFLGRIYKRWKVTHTV